MDIRANNKKEKNAKFNLAFFILIYSFVLKLFNSLASPIFTENAFQADNNVFYSMGVAILKGKVLYKDIIDNKTPYTYFINSIASFLNRSHIGLYIIESIFLFFTLYFIYKILLLYIRNQYASFIGSACFAILLSMTYFTRGMSKTECYTMPFLLIALYMTIKYIIGSSDQIVIDNQKDLFLRFTLDKKIYKFVLGFLAIISFMFNIKHASVFLIIYLLLISFCIVNKKYKEIIEFAIFGFVGVLVGVMPYLIYVIATQSFYSAYYGIFVLPFRYVGKGTSLFYNGDTILDSIIFFASRFKVFFVFVIISFLIVVIKEKNIYIKILYILSLIITLIYTVLPNAPYNHYLIQFFVFLLPIYILIYKNLNKVFVDKLFRDEKKKQQTYNQSNGGFFKKQTSIIMTLILTVVTFFVSILISYVDLKKQYPAIVYCNKSIKEAVTKYIDDTRTLNLLAVGFIPEVYVALDNIISFPCFITMNNKYKGTKEFVDAQVSYVVNKEAEVVVVNEKDSLVSFSPEKREELLLGLESAYIMVERVDTKTTNGIYDIYIRK